LSQKYSRKILDSYYGSTPFHGWEGDEDEGQMGAWFVMTSLGLFEMDGGTTVEPMVDLSSPLFEKIVIDLDPRYYSGGQFVIEARGNSEKNIYIQSAALNGKQLKVAKIRFSEIVGGGTLVFEMGPEPNQNWGILAVE
jgi:putative alpha-1,2-mannosidase